MSLFSKDKNCLVDNIDYFTEHDIKKEILNIKKENQMVVKIMNIVESIISNAAPEIKITPKFIVLKSLLGKLNKIYLPEKES